MHPPIILRSVGAALALGLASTTFAEAWSFGVIGDTQWAGVDPTGNNVNTVAVNQIRAVNAQFVAAGVDFVVQVGDLCDSNGANNAALQTRLNANSALNDAGIAFYGLRGNHESGTGSKTFFQQNYLPASTGSATVAVAPDGISYSVNYNDTKIVLLDISLAGSTTLQPAATTWMSGQLAAADHTQAFVFTHKNLLGQNHKDSFFGGSNDANPALQNSFIKAVADNDVRYVISGHDHLHHRSAVVSPDGQSSVQQIITASDSYKYYTPAAPYSSRETPIAQELGKTGYYLYTVDGPRVTGQYFATTPLPNGDVAANPVWTLQETFGYSLNGTSRLVGQGDSYALTHTIDAGTSFGESGYVGTTMAILAGTNGSSATVSGNRATAKDVEIGWAPATSGPAGALSDVLDIWGMSEIGQGGRTDPFALSLTFDATGLSTSYLQSGLVGIYSEDAFGRWVNTVDLNFAGLATFHFGAYDSSYGLGSYGISFDATDPTHTTAWAVVDHNSKFVVAIPEPSTYAALFGAAALVVVVLRRRRRTA